MEHSKRIAHLEKQIAELEEEAEVIRKWEGQILSKNHFTTEQKAAIYDVLYHYAFNYIKEWTETGWEPKITLEEGIRKVVDYEKRNLEEG